MAKFEYELEFEPRKLLGKGASRRLRSQENRVLGVIYGANETSEPISLAQNHVTKALENEGTFSHILTLSTEGKKQKVVLKDIQRHPYKPYILHMDFMRIDENKPIIMHIPLHFKGQDEAPGVVTGGGTVTHHMVELEIKCLPRYLPEYIEIDLSNAPLDTIVHLSQVPLPEGVEMIQVIHGADDDLPVVSIHKPKRIEVEEVAAPTEEAAPAEGEAKGESATPKTSTTTTGKEGGKGKETGKGK